MTKELYSTNDEFKQFCDKYCVKHDISLEKAFSHDLVKETARYYKEKITRKETK